MFLCSSDDVLTDSQILHSWVSFNLHMWSHRGGPQRTSSRESVTEQPGTVQQARQEFVKRVEDLQEKVLKMHV